MAASEQALEVLERNRHPGFVEALATVAWQFHEAEQRFSALVERAMTEGPQVVTRHGREVIVIVSIEEYRRLFGDDPDLRQFIMEAPLLDLEIDRPAMPARRIEL